VNPNHRELRVLIIGSGPVGAITASLALEKNFDVTMVDIGCSERELMEINNLGLKTFDGSVHPYDLGQYTNLDFGDLGYKWRTSKGKFGFSTVWGGTWARLNSLKTADWDEAYSRVEDIIARSSREYISKCSCASIKIDETGGSSPLSLLMNSNESHTKIWSTDNLISHLSINTNFRYLKGNVINFQENDLGVSATTNEGNLLDFDFIYLCCGPVANANLILNSKPKPAQIVLRDTQIIYVPFLYRKKNKFCKEITNFPVRSASVINEKGEIETYFQIYPHVNEYLEQILSKFPKVLWPALNPLLELLFSRIGIALGYRSQENSSSIILNSGPITFVKELAPENKLPRFTLMTRSFNKLKSLGLLPIPMLIKFGSPGDSYHLGMAENIVQPENGSVEGFNRVFALGAISLPKLDPGPITYSAMAQAVIGFNYSLEQLPKLRQ
jgi:hypothetical protein